MLRVLHGPANLANQPWVLSRYERACGVQSDLVAVQASPYGYQADRVLNPAPRRTWTGLARRALFGLTAPWRYDVIHAYFGRSYLALDGGWWTGPWRLDLDLARRLGRKVFMTFQGCDARQADRADTSTPHACQSGLCRRFTQCRSGDDERRRRVIMSLVPRCDRIFVLNPDLLRMVPEAQFLPYASVDVECLVPREPRRSGPIRIVHAPSDPSLKGTDFVRRAIDALRPRWPIEFQLIHGVDHATTLAALAEADLVVDQLLLGWYGGLAVEAMAMGKPVVTYLRPRDRALIPTAMDAELPILSAEPGQLVERLEGWLHQRSHWSDWSHRARRFAWRWHHPGTIARAMIAAYVDSDSRFQLAPTAEVERCAA